MGFTIGFMGPPLGEGNGSIGLRWGCGFLSPLSSSRDVHRHKDPKGGSPGAILHDAGPKGQWPRVVDVMAWMNVPRKEVAPMNPVSRLP